MQLKTYQQNALEQLDRWLEALKEALQEKEEAKEFYAKRVKPIPDDTSYKQKLLETLEAAYNKALDRGEMRVCEPPAVFRMMFEDRWKEQVGELVAK